MKDLSKRVLERAGLLSFVRTVWRLQWTLPHKLRARGLLKWKPLVPEAEFSACVERVIGQLRQLEPATGFGAYLEFGVSRGTSMSCVHEVLSRQGLDEMAMIGFDSFEGLPPSAGDEGWLAGEFHSTQADTRRYLASRGVPPGRVELVAGWFADTLNDATRRRLGIEKASLIMVDCDIYSASVEALRFCAPLIRTHAVIMFDDWASRDEDPRVRGQREAFAEFLQAHPHVEATPMESYFVLARVFLVSRRAAQEPGAT